jgi:hypothetical protein
LSDEALPALRALSIARNALVTLDSIGPISTARVLNVRGMGAGATRGVVAPSLVAVYADGNSLGGLGAWAECHGLQRLWMTRNRMSGLEGVARWAALADLDLRENEVCAAVASRSARDGARVHDGYVRGFAD